MGTVPISHLRASPVLGWGRRARGLGVQKGLGTGAGSPASKERGGVRLFVRPPCLLASAEGVGAGVTQVDRRPALRELSDGERDPADQIQVLPDSSVI